MIIDDPDKGADEDNFAYYDGHNRCKHLVGDKAGEYSCAIHDKEWYSETPCFNYTQIERSPKDKCRIGITIIERRENGLDELYPQKYELFEKRVDIF
jgi:hypothetical protein